MIAINNNLAASFKIIPVKCKAEILAVEILLENKTKILISTCYRVGTLGLNNAEEILKAVSTLMRKKSAKKVILVGDFNLLHINWSDGTRVSTIDNTFLMVLRKMVWFNVYIVQLIIKVQFLIFY